MPNHGGDQGGRPSLLTPDVQETICAAIRRGCYATVAATRAGVDDFTMSLWDKRGQREAEQRALGKVSEDTPASVYEQFHRALAKAKAEARYSAETRVFDAMPLAWLKSGYARNDWHQSNQLVREVVDELVKRVPADWLKAFLTAGDPPRTPTSHEQYAHEEMMRFADLDTERGREEMQRHVKTCPICRADAARKESANGRAG
jgi:hypothetical protein